MNRIQLALQVRKTLSVFAFRHSTTSINVTLCGVEISNYPIPVRGTNFNMNLPPQEPVRLQVRLTYDNGAIWNIGETERTYINLFRL